MNFHDAAHAVDLTDILARLQRLEELEREAINQNLAMQQMLGLLRTLIIDGRERRGDLSIPKLQTLLFFVPVQAPGATLSEIQEAIKGKVLWSRNTLIRHLKHAVKRGLVKKDKKRYTRVDDSQKESIKSHAK